MSRRPALFRQSDVARVMRAATRLGFKVTEVKVEPGGQIRVAVMDGVPLGDDAELAQFRAKHGYQ